MDKQRTRGTIEAETELTLTVAPVTAGSFVAGDITVTAHFAPERAGSRYRVVLTVTNLGEQTAGAFDITARVHERRNPGSHRLRAVTHSVAVLEPGASVKIESLDLFGHRPVKVRGAAAAEMPHEWVWSAAA